MCAGLTRVDRSRADIGVQLPVQADLGVLGRASSVLDLARSILGDEAR
jgi:hypothetical protein